MKKFTSKINETKEKTQLEMGIEVESEHLDVYEELERWLKSKGFNTEMPWTKKEFYEKIAKAHIKEIPDYYTRLLKMEKDK